MGKIIGLNMPAERTLKNAIDHGLDQVVICAFDKDGNEYFASSVADGGDALWLLERAKKKLVDLADSF